MKKFLKFLLVFSIAFFVSSSKSYADTSCQPIYGGGQSCITTNNIVINKTVLNPETSQFVDNLGTNDPKYRPGYIVTFQISVTNTGDNTISKVTVKDVLPQYIIYSSGAESFDSNTNTVYFNLTNLVPDETRTFTILGRVFDSNDMPGDTGSTVCVVNQAIATADDDSTSQDNAQFCIEKTVQTKGGFPVLTYVPASTSPSTGAESLAWLALIPTGTAGYLLRKFSNKTRG